MIALAWNIIEPFPSITPGICTWPYLFCDIKRYHIQACFSYSVNSIHKMIPYFCPVKAEVKVAKTRYVNGNFLHCFSKLKFLSEDREDIILTRITIALSGREAK